MQGLQPGLLPAHPEGLALGPLQEPIRTCRPNAYRKHSQLPTSDVRQYQSAEIKLLCIIPANLERGRSDNQYILQTSNSQIQHKLSFAELRARKVGVYLVSLLRGCRGTVFTRNFCQHLPSGWRWGHFRSL